eukprot:508968-Heterocapsa_arctica.AAC.1
MSASPVASGRIAPALVEEHSTSSFALADLQHELDDLHLSSSISYLLRHLHVAKICSRHDINTARTGVAHGDKD